MNEARQRAIERARRHQNLPEPQQTQFEDDQVPYFVLDEDKSTQISGANLDNDNDVVCYIKLSLMTPTAVKNVIQSGDLLDHCQKQNGYFIISLRDDIAGVIKALIDEAMSDKNNG